MKEADVVRVQLVREATFQYSGERLSSPERVVDVVGPQIADADREHLVALLVNARHALLAVHTVSIGTLDSSTAHPREVFKAAVLANAAGVVLVHNHPSGDPSPSQDDLAATQQLAEAGRILGIEVLDHVIIAGSRWVSLRRMGVIG